MPRKPIDYSNTYFYKIVCRDLNTKDCYVGHTTDFTKRKSQHKHACCKENDKCHKYMFMSSSVRREGGIIGIWLKLIKDIVRIV